MSPRRSALVRFLAGHSLRARRRLREAGDQGFTLIELVIVLVILPLIMGAIAVALLVTLQDSAGVSSKITSSVDAVITSAFYNRDVQSAQYVTTGVPGATPWPAGAGAAACGTGTPGDLVVSLAWGSGKKLATGATEESIVSYWRGDLVGGTGSVSGRTLTATSGGFTPGDAGQAIVQTTGTAVPFGTAVASYVSPTQVTLTKTATAASVHFQVGPTLTRKHCLGTGAASQVTTSHDFFTPFLRASVACITTSTICTGASSAWIPAEPVTSVTLAAMEPSGRYDYNVSATPRVSDASGSAALCTPSACKPHKVPTLLLLATGTVNVIKQAAASHVIIEGTTVMNTGYFVQGNGSTFLTTAGEKVKGTNICPKKTDCRTVTPAPAKWTTLTTRVPDPFAGLPDPPAAVTRGCPAVTGSTVTLPPGLYTCEIQVTGGRTLRLQHGVYEFADGVSLNNATLTGTTVFIYLPCYPVDPWDPVHSCSASFTLKNSPMTVTAMKTGPGADMWFWQNKTDGSTAQLAGPNALSTTGIMYAPSATVKLSGGSTSTSTLGAVIAQKLTVLNGTFKIHGLPYTP